jgi:predicted RNase H-like HicB family nuclease
MRWTVIYEQDPASGDWAARAADLPVYVGGDTREEVGRLIVDAIAMHLASLRDEGLPPPTPRSTAGDVEVTA